MYAPHTVEYPLQQSLQWTETNLYNVHEPTTGHLR